MKKLKQEMVWAVLGICGALSQLGGSDYAPKAFRRFGIPITLALAFLYFVGFNWSLVLFVVSQWAVFTMPVTLIGDSIPNYPLNWFWIPVWAVCKGAPSLFLNYRIWPAVIVCGFFLTLMVYLSNIPATASWFQWKTVEFFSGLTPAICLCYAVTKKK